MTTLYHITDKRNVPDILKHGLKPGIGSNSKICYEEKPLIYLTDEMSVPYWQILLGIETPVILAVQLNETPELVKYYWYNEYITDAAIPADRITTVTNINSQITDKEVLQNLCYDQMIALSHICVTIVTCYERNESLKPFIDDITRELAVCKRLNFTCYSQKSWQELLKAYGNEGAYTFCDKYDVWGNKQHPPLWQKITMYPQDEFTDIRNNISEFIQKSFPDCLDLNTGGWTG